MNDNLYYILLVLLILQVLQLQLLLLGLGDLLVALE